MKQNKRIKVLGIATTLALSLGVLVGCSSNTPTPESLLTGAFGTEPVSSVSMDLDCNMNAKADMSAVGMEGTMDMSYNIDSQIDVDKDGNYHLTGNLGYKIFGMNGKEPIDTYSIVKDKKNQTVYTKHIDDNKKETWTYETTKIEDSQKEFVSSAVSMINKDNFEKDTLKLKGENKTLKTYTVTGQMGVDKLGDSLNSASELLMSGDDLTKELKKLKFDVTMEFDKETKLLKEVKFILNTDKASKTVKESVSKFDIVIKIKKLNKVKVLLPEKIKKTAVKTQNLYSQDTETNK